MSLTYHSPAVWMLLSRLQPFCCCWEVPNPGGEYKVWASLPIYSDGTDHR